jgi:dephospho-CoA kinase
MKNWLLTGGVGCGKTSVGQILAAQMVGKISSFSADREVSSLLTESEVIDRITEKFGDDVLAYSDGIRGLDKHLLRERVFIDPGLRSELEAILHPRVLVGLESQRAEMDASGKELFLAEVPLHYEIGETITADLVIVVAASRAMQVRRLMECRGLEEPIIEQILRSQWPIEAKVEKADVVIWNDGDEAALEAQVLTLLRQHWHDTNHRNP